MNSPDDSDSLDDLLGRPEPGQTDETLRRGVLAGTTPVLARRRIARRCGWAAAFAGCYLAGVASMGLWQFDTPPLALTWREPEQREAGQAHESTTPEPQEKPRIAERQKTPFEKLRDAGDEAWRARGDIEEAIRLYAQALRVATAEEKISSADDNWILIALKEDHLTESRHDGKNDES
ncbi:MAG TPA: hypothetical protein VHY91_26725 [Pirellulales bacterium]|jgi:hypothetical protein|nr:hypothetical protein [Pirellulales bacterium]